MDFLSGIVRAITQMEGGKPGDLNMRNNNPGNLVSGIGQVGKNEGFAVFPSPGAGLSALNAWVTSHAAAHPDWNFYDLFNFYLRGSTTAQPVDAQGNSKAYAQYVAGQIGVDPSTPVQSLLGEQS